MTPEQIARELAKWHGQKMLYRKPDGPMMTVAMHRQNTESGFAGVVDDYVRKHWKEYIAAAEFVESIRLSVAKEMQERCAKVAEGPFPECCGRFVQHYSYAINSDGSQGEATGIVGEECCGCPEPRPGDAEEIAAAIRALDPEVTEQ